MRTLANSEDTDYHQFLHCFRKQKRSLQNEVYFQFKNYNLWTLDKNNGPSQAECIKTRRKNPLVHKMLMIKYRD